MKFIVQAYLNEPFFGGTNEKETALNVFKIISAALLAAAMGLSGVGHAQTIEKVSNGIGTPKHVEKMAKIVNVN